MTNEGFGSIVSQSLQSAEDTSQIILDLNLFLEEVLVQFAFSPNCFYAS